MDSISFLTKGKYLFQFLIGTVKIDRRDLVLCPGSFVSIPYRYCKNKDVTTDDLESYMFQFLIGTVKIKAFFLSSGDV